MPKNNLEQAPYTVDANGILQLLEKYYTHHSHNVQWLPNPVFSADMEFIPETTFKVLDRATGRSYVVFPKEVSRYIEYDLINAGHVTGNWRVIKRGMCFGIERVN